MVLSSLQDQSHVASLLGYSSFGEVTALGPPLTPAPSARPPSSSSSVDAYDPLHLAEVLLRTLLLSIGFYTVLKRCIVHTWFCLSNNVAAFQKVLCFLSILVHMFTIKLELLFLILRMLSVCSCRSGHSESWRRTVTSSYRVKARDRLILPVTSTSCCQDCTNTCWAIATSIQALRYTHVQVYFTRSSVVIWLH